MISSIRGLEEGTGGASKNTWEAFISLELGAFRLAPFCDSLVAFLLDISFQQIKVAGVSKMTSSSPDNFAWKIYTMKSTLRLGMD